MQSGFIQNLLGGVHKSSDLIKAKFLKETCPLKTQ